MTRITHSRLPGFLGLVLAMPLCACEFSKQLDPEGIAENGSTGSTGDGEMSGTTVGTTNGASMSSTSASTTASDETTGGTTSSDTFGDEIVCDPGAATLALTIDGVEHSVAYEAGGMVTSPVGTEFQLGEEGALIVRGAAGIDGPSSVQAEGYVRLPSDAAMDPGAWFCFDETSTYFSNGDDLAVAKLNGLAKFGPCPGGTPVDGTITVCFGDPSCGGASAIEGSLGPDGFSEPLGGYSTQEALGGERYAIDIGGDPFASGGQLGFSVAAAEGNGPQVLPLESPYFIVPLAYADGSAIYCGGAGSTITLGDADQGVLSIELVGLTRLGSCDDVDATGEGMYCSNLGG